MLLFGKVLAIFKIDFMFCFKYKGSNCKNYENEKNIKASTVDFRSFGPTVTKIQT